MTRLKLVGMAVAVVTAAALAFDVNAASLEDILKEVEAAYDAGEFEKGDGLLAVADQRFAGDEKLVRFEITVAISKGKFEEALSLVDDWLAGHPQANDFRALRAYVLDKLDRDGEAIAAMEALTATDPNPDYVLQLANLLFTQKDADYGRIVGILEQALVGYADAKRPVPPDVFYNLACAYARTGNAERAVANLKAAATADSGYLLLAATDLDFDGMRGDKEFSSLIAEGIKSNILPQEDLMTVKPGDAAPAFNLPSYDGGSWHALEEYKGSYVVLNFFATWCPPCKAEIPDFVAFAAAHEKDGVRVVGVSVDDAEADLGGFVKEFGINYPVVRDDGAAAQKYLAVGKGIPQTYFIDKDGVVRNHIYGRAPRQVLEGKLSYLMATH